MSDLIKSKTTFFLKIFIYLFMRIHREERERDRDRDRDTGRGRSRLHAGSPMQDTILGPQDHALGQSQVLNH